MPSGFNNRPAIGQQIADNVAGNVSGIFSTRATAKYMSGARSVLKINGEIAGFAFGIQWRINTAVTEINTIDDYMPYELAPQRITVEGSITALHVPGKSVGVELWQPDALSFLFHKYITIEVRDITTDALLFYTTKAMITSRAEDIKVEQLANVQLTFKAIGFRDEREPTLPTEPPSDGSTKPSDAGIAGAMKNLLGKLPF